MTISTKKSQVGRETAEPRAERYSSKVEQSLGGGSGRIIYNDGLAEHDDQH